MDKETTEFVKELIEGDFDKYLLESIMSNDEEIREKISDLLVKMSGGQ